MSSKLSSLVYDHDHGQCWDCNICVATSSAWCILQYAVVNNRNVHILFSIRIKYRSNGRPLQLFFLWIIRTSWQSSRHQLIRNVEWILRTAAYNSRKLNFAQTNCVKSLNVEIVDTAVLQHYVLQRNAHCALVLSVCLFHYHDYQYRISCSPVLDMFAVAIIQSSLSVLTLSAPFIHYIKKVKLDGRLDADCVVLWNIDLEF